MNKLASYSNFVLPPILLFSGIVAARMRVEKNGEPLSFRQSLLDRAKVFAIASATLYAFPVLVPVGVWFYLTSKAFVMESTKLPGRSETTFRIVNAREVVATESD